MQYVKDLSSPTDASEITLNYQLCKFLLSIYIYHWIFIIVTRSEGSLVPKYIDLDHCCLLIMFHLRVIREPETMGA